MKVLTVVMAMVTLLWSGVVSNAQDDAGKERKKIMMKVMEMVEKKLKENDEKILADVKAMLEKEVGKKSGEKGAEKPQANARKGFLGISAEEVDEDTRSELGLKEGEGVKVSNVQGDSAAEKAGLEIDDVVLSVDGKAVGSLDDLRGIITSKKEGDTVAMTYLRGKDKKTVKVKLGPWPDEDEN